MERKTTNKIGLSPVVYASRAQAGVARVEERDVLISSIRATAAIKNLIRSSLGPRAMSKLLDTMKDAKRDIVVTDDGYTILERIPVKNPIVKIMVDAVKTHYTEVGDGTKTMIILTGELLERASSLLSMRLHPSVIVTGYKMACNKALQILNEISIPIEFRDNATLEKIAISSMSSMVTSSLKRALAGTAVEAFMNILENIYGVPTAKLEDVKFVKKAGQGLSQTQLIKGLIIEKPVLHKDMPRRVENPKILLLDYSLDPYKHRLNAEIHVESSHIKKVIDESMSTIRSWIEKIKASGANVVICQKTVSEEAKYLLARNNVMAVHEVKLSDMERLAKATGAKIIHILDALKPEDLGTAGLAEERKICDEKLLFIEGCKDPKSVSILIRGGVEKSIDELERALKHSISALINVVKKGKVVAGGGAVEVEIAKRLHDYARQVRGREQLAVQCFIEAMESIPKILAENAGLTPLDVITDLRHSHCDEGGLWVGLDVSSRKIGDMMEKGVTEPVYMKEQTLKSAVEVASMILTVNKVIVKPRVLSPVEKVHGSPL